MALSAASATEQVIVASWSIPYDLIKLGARGWLSSRPDISVSWYKNDYTYLRKHRDAWVLEGRVMGTRKNNVIARIRDIELYDLTLIKPDGIPFLADHTRTSLDLSSFNFEEQRVDQLSNGRQFPEDGNRELQNNMQYQIRYHFERTDALDILAQKHERMEATIRFKFYDRRREFSRFVTMPGPITEMERGLVS